MSALDLRPDLDALFATFGTDATVTPVGGAPVSCVAVLEGDVAPRAGQPPIEVTSPRVAVRRSDVAALPIGSTILMARAPGRTPETLTVIRVDHLDPELLTAVVQ